MVTKHCWLGFVTTSRMTMIALNSNPMSSLASYVQSIDIFILQFKYKSSESATRLSAHNIQLTIPFFEKKKKKKPITI